MAQRILVVDDDRQIVRLVKSYLEKENFSVLTAYDGEDAMRSIRAERPDLIVLDLMLPKRDGLQITRWLRSDEKLAATPILMLTARVHDSDRIMGLEIGADDYLTKPFNPREVVARVRAILRRTRKTPNAPHILEIGELTLDIDQHTATHHKKALELTPTEFELLRVLMENPNHAFTRGELIEQAVGYEYEGFERTLDSHIKNLRKKIEIDPGKPQLIETVFGVGYRMRDVISPTPLIKGSKREIPRL